jgi:hypothetical protein
MGYLVAEQSSIDLSRDGTVKATGADAGDRWSGLE